MFALCLFGRLCGLASLSYYHCYSPSSSFPSCISPPAFPSLLPPSIPSLPPLTSKLPPSPHRLPIASLASSSSLDGAVPPPPLFLVVAPLRRARYVPQLGRPSRSAITSTSARESGAGVRGRDRGTSMSRSCQPRAAESKGAAASAGSPSGGSPTGKKHLHFQHRCSGETSTRPRGAGSASRAQSCSGHAARRGDACRVPPPIRLQGQEGG